MSAWDRLGEELGPARDLVAEYVLRRKNERPDGKLPVTFHWHRSRFCPPKVTEERTLGPEESE